MRPLQNLLFLIWSIFLALQCVGQTTFAKIDSIIATYVQQKEFNGTALVAQKGKILLEKGYGYKNKSKGALNDTNTIFQIGSITKQFTSTIILQLAEKKQLNLQDRLSKYFSDFPKGDSITIEQLLTHTSGVYNYTNDADFMKSNSEKPISRDSLIARFKNKPFDFEPGTKWSYSNSGYILLGAIIEKLTGKTYFSVVRENIFQPLGMNHSGFDLTDLSSPDKAIGYSEDFSTEVGIVDSSVSFAAGSIYSTVGDLYRWDRALYTNQIVSQTSLENAFTEYKSSYGYGWFIRDAFGKKTVGHPGGISGFSSFMMRVPEDETFIILLCNFPSPALAKIDLAIDALLNGQEHE